MDRALRRVLFFLTLVATYFVVGRLGLSLAFVHSSASAVWPATGVAMAAVLLFGVQIWPAIAIGAFLVNVTTSGSVAASAGIAAGNTLEALAGARLLQRYGGASAALTAPGIFRLAAFAGLAATLAATIGVASLEITGLMGAADPGSVWMTWWLGDLTGAILVVPLILLFARPPADGLTSSRALELALLLVTVISVGLVVFAYPAVAGVRLPIEFLAIPALVWPAFRFGPRETALACALVSVLAVWGTVNGLGPFGAYAPALALPLLQGFTAITTATMIAASAEVTARRTRDAEVRRFADVLERRVREGTEDARRAHGRLADAQVVAHVGSWEWDIAANDIWWSEELYRIYGVSPATFGASYEGLLKLVHPDDRELVDRTVREALERRAPFSFEHRIVRPDGSTRHLYGRGYVVSAPDGTPVRMTGIGQDISERKQAEEARAALIHEQAARREAEQASQAKDAFLASLSHELRTPLNAILGWAHMLQHGSIDEKMRDRAVDAIYRNAVAQQRLVSDILDVSRIASGRFPIRMLPVSLKAVVEMAIEAVGPAAAPKNLRLVLDVEPGVELVSGDEARLGQVLTNLLDNAIKFSPPDGSVRVQAARDGDWIHVTVADEGPGIEPDFLPRVFEPFTQSDASTTREHAGLGLGLSIVQRIVELHNGTVSAANRSDRTGAIFTVSLPAAVSTTA
jgi:PAS domain S-box-containing protein